MKTKVFTLSSDQFHVGTNLRSRLGYSSIDPTLRLFVSPLFSFPGKRSFPWASQIFLYPWPCSRTAMTTIGTTSTICGASLKPCKTTVPSFVIYLDFFQLACLSLPENLKLVRSHALVTRGQRFVRSMNALRLLFGFRKEVPSHVIVDIRLLLLLLLKGFAAATVFLFLCLSLEGEKRSRSFD